ncbi:MAG: hypothetical protein JJE04_13755 [Acidobacteriia bacterium]|nr:hypothetical protein [Terriglobia bacterium]
MNPPFVIHTTPGFDRMLKQLTKQHPDLAERMAEVFSILPVDPYNVSRQHPIKKLKGIKPGDGQHRIRLGRWRFRYDIVAQVVELVYCGLRREDTY